MKPVRRRQSHHDRPPGVGRTIPRSVVRIAVAVILAMAGCARLYVEAPTGGVSGGNPAELSVVYLIGDFGKPSEPFRQLVAAIRDDVAALEGRAPRVGPMILELGDNLYEEGLPHDLTREGAAAEVEKLRAIAAAFADVRIAGDQVPLVLIPGNHDYNDNALESRGNLGDISRWYFLDELAIEGAAAWTHVPGDRSGFAGAGELFEHLEGDPAARAEFMAPLRVPRTDEDLHIIAIDSELLLDLYAAGHDDLAAAYWEHLDRVLAAVPNGSWRMIAAHHPPVTYGKHGVPSFGNWVFGQGYPQFPYTWQKLLAGALPLGIVLGVVAHPLATVLAAAPSVTTALVSGRKQDVGSEPYDRYAAAVLGLAARHDVDVVLAGHDHNTQIIELEEVDGFAGDTLLIITGAGSKVDPVRRGPGTVAYLSDYSWVRLTQYERRLSFEIIDQRGNGRYRYDLPRSDAERQERR